MQGEGGQNAGLAEFMIMPSGNPYRKISHGMTDSSMAMVAFHVASDARAKLVWRRFQEIEDAFYRVQDLRAPTWISSSAGSYGPGDLNRRAPDKDCVAMARTWRSDALMRRRMKDGQGLLRTIGYANALYDRPSGGGAGLFAERYGLGRFQPGDEAQATIPAYAEYPAVYNSTIVQQCLLGVDVDVLGRVVIDPCVPEDWHRQGFDHEGLGVLQNHRLAVRHEWDRLEGWMVGPDSQRDLRVRIPPGLAPEAVSVQVNGKKVDHRTFPGLVEFSLELSGRNRSVFVVEKDL